VDEVKLCQSFFREKRRVARRGAEAAEVELEEGCTQRGRGHGDRITIFIVRPMEKR